MLGRYDRAMRARQPVGGQTLLARAIAAIKRNNGALFYVPQNFSGAWTDRAGTDPVDAVADVIGLMTDRSYGANNRGTELFSIASVAAGITNNNGALTVAAVANGSTIVTTNHTLVVGKTYEVTFTVSGYVAGGVSIRSGTTGSVGAVVGVSNGVFMEVFSPTISSENFQFMTRYSRTTLTISNVSVKEVFGAVATQATTASKPLVHRVPKRLGPNLVSNGSITGLPAGGGTRFYNMTGAMTPLVAGKTYLMTYTVSGYSGTGNAGIAGAAPAGIVQTNNTANGSYRAIQTPTAAGVIVFFTTNTNTANFSAIDVREVLEWSYAMSFDGSNDSLTTNITTGNEGWICAGVTFGGAGNETVAESGALAADATKKGIWLFSWGGVGLEMQIGNGVSITTQNLSSVPLIGVPLVVEGGWDASSLLVGANGVIATKARTGDASPAGSVLQIGSYQGAANTMNGPMTAQVICPVLPSAADRAIIRKWIGSLQGQSL